MDENVKKFSYKESSEPIFDINNGILESMSAKLTNILTGLKENNAKGIIFIYSDYIYSGVLPIALALEHMGFEKFGGKNILDYPEWKKNSENTKSEPIDFQWNVRENKTTDVFNRARYIILSGNKNLSPNNPKVIQKDFRVGDVFKTHANIDKIKKLKFSPHTKINEGIKLTYKWYEHISQE